MEIHWAHSCQMYVTPVSANEVCVALISGNPHLRLDAALAAFPEIALRLRHAAISSLERGAVSSTRQLRSVQNGRVALVGDASGAVDAITGEGLCLAFQQAQALATSFASGDLRTYQVQHRCLARRPALLARLMLALDWKTSLRQQVMRAFISDPNLFQRMLAMHVGALSPLAFARTGISLCCQLCKNAGGIPDAQMS